MTDTTPNPPATTDDIAADGYVPWTPQSVRDTRFEAPRGRRKAYDAESVDSFRERMAVEIEWLHARIRDLMDENAHLQPATGVLQRGEPANAGQVTGTDPFADVDEQALRTRMAARQEADTVIERANTQGTHIIMSSRQQADALLVSARQRADELVADAERRAAATAGPPVDQAETVPAEVAERGPCPPIDTQRLAESLRARVAWWRSGYENSLGEVQALFMVAHDLLSAPHPADEAAIEPIRWTHGTPEQFHDPGEVQAYAGSSTGDDPGHWATDHAAYLETLATERAAEIDHEEPDRDTGDGS